MTESRARNTYASLLKPEFRTRIDALLLKFEADFYEKIPFAKHMLNTDAFSMDFYKRANVETILRIALKRAVDPLIANYWATRDAVLCKEWGLYGAEEGRHDRMFARDLHEVGMTDDEIYAHRPSFATELLNGYFYYTMATEGPLASMVSGFYLEWMAGKTQPDWLDRVEKHIGTEKTRGARAHLAGDIEDQHVDMVWNMIMRVLRTPEDEARFTEHLIKINSLFVAYFVEVAEQAFSKSVNKELPVAGISAVRAAAAAASTV